MQEAFTFSVTMEKGFVSIPITVKLKMTDEGLYYKHFYHHT